MRSDDEGTPTADESKSEQLTPEEIGQRLDELLGQATGAIPVEGKPRRIGRFEVRQALGFGAFGIVYEAFDPELNREVAIKLPRLEVLMDDDRRRRFVDEANLSASLDHPGIVPVYEASLEGPTPYIVSQLIAGPDLAEWVRSNDGPVPWREAVDTLIGLAEAVHYAHSQGVHHRDLKPSNILLQPRDLGSEGSGSLSKLQIRITDFGLAKVAAAEQVDTRTSLVLGTPLYMAPEVLSQQVESTDERRLVVADIYSLGVILYELVSGKPPRSDMSYGELFDKVSNQPLPLLSVAVREVPASLNQICRKCLEIDPDARYATAQELADDLTACKSGKPVLAGHGSLSRRVAYWSKRPKRITDAGRFLIAISAGFAIWMVASLVAATFWTSMTSEDYAAIVGDFCTVMLLVYLPNIFIGWQTVNQKAWAIRTGCVLTALGCLPPLIPLATGPVLFQELYANDKTYLVFAMHLMIGLPGVAAFLFYLLAWRAHNDKHR